MTSERGIGFESDAATDFTPWGLARPFLILSFIDQDISDSINPDSAKRLLGAQESLEVTRWLANDDAAAYAALASPALTLTVDEKQVDDQGRITGVDRHELKFAPQPGATPPPFYYDCLTSDGQPFLIERATFENLVQLIPSEHSRDIHKHRVALEGPDITMPSRAFFRKGNGIAEAGP